MESLHGNLQTATPWYSNSNLFLITSSRTVHSYRPTHSSPTQPPNILLQSQYHLFWVVLEACLIPNISPEVTHSMKQIVAHVFGDRSRKKIYSTY
ncbi:hypothetical protein XBJ1_2783 [Xenorhabdus bovienii SS-2004]|uniref:Uncharacterized protein n=1 Tax=Xenorhabdus bovienii (strain SS-2004) TaxID=406818 RepID=D3V7U5_XENBS|nr:hypothetical protein XBJ1_2783 [Xenorhabdus bovienii SS-2004]